MLVYVINPDGKTATPVDITLQSWDDNSGWSPDCFADLECNLHWYARLTPEEYHQVIDYWNSEVDDHNAGKSTEQFGDPDDEDTWPVQDYFDEDGEHTERVKPDLVEYLLAVDERDAIPLEDMERDD